jgi:hypothetical protein
MSPTQRMTVDEKNVRVALVSSPERAITQSKKSIGSITSQINRIGTVKSWRPHTPEEIIV